MPRRRVLLAILVAVAASALAVAVALAAVGDIATVAGGFIGEGVSATSARLRYPLSVAVDSTGNLFIANGRDNNVRRVDGVTGVITTAAGDGTSGFSGDGGLATGASLFAPRGLAADASGHLFIADAFNDRIRRVAADTEIITTVAGDGATGFSGDGGPATSASLNRPNAVAIDASGNLFIADGSNYRVRRVDAATGIITTVAGDGTLGGSGDGGPATSASFNYANGVAVDGSGNLFIAESHRIRRVDGATGIITTVVGGAASGFSGDGGPATSASLNFPSGLAVDGSGNLYISDSFNYRVRRVDAATGVITTVAGDGIRGFSGDGGPATSASLNVPWGVAVDTSGNVYIADRDNHRVRRVDAATGVITTVAGGFVGDGGPATSSSLNSPAGIALDASGNLYIADSAHHRVRLVDGATGTITTVAGTTSTGFSGDGGPATTANLNSPQGVAVDGSGNLYISDTFNHRVRRVDAATGVITTVAGDGASGFSGDGGTATSASLKFPRGLAVDAAGNLLIADENHRVRRVDASSGIITTAAGNGTSGFSDDGGPATSASLNLPRVAAVDTSGNVYIADRSNHRVRLVDGATGTITTVAGTTSTGFSGDGGPATTANLNSPQGVAVDGSGNLYISDTLHDRIRRVDAATGVITTVAGDGVRGFSGDGGPATSANLDRPGAVAIDASGNLFIAVGGNGRIRVVLGAAAAATPIPSLTQWGLVVLAVLIAGILVLRSMRASTRSRLASRVPSARTAIV